MCGRFVLLTDLSRIVERFGIDEVACDYVPRDNISPGQQVATIVRDSATRLVACRWGLVPRWAADPSIGRRMFNARAETLAVKPSFRHAFRDGRCLIPADGFYEWQRTGSGKRPFRISLATAEPFAFAGLHETWVSPSGEALRSCTLVTTEPNGLVAPIHDRMPAIVARADEAAWIDPANPDPAALLAILRPYPPAAMRAVPRPPGRT